MTDRTIVVFLPDGRPLALAEAEFQQALAAGAAFSAPAQPPVVSGGIQPLVDSAEMARLMGCASTTVEAMAAAGTVPSVRVGKLLRFNPIDVLEILRSRPPVSGTQRRMQAHEFDGRSKATNHRTTKPAARLSAADPRREAR